MAFEEHFVLNALSEVRRELIVSKPSGGEEWAIGFTVLADLNSIVCDHFTTFVSRLLKQTLLIYNSE